jgi:hypothetical protein
MTIAVTGYGTQFAIETGPGTNVFTDLVEVTDITPPNDKLDIIEATHMTSPNANKEFIVGLNDPGECGVTINWIPSGQADTILRAWRNSRQARKCRITFNNATPWTFAGILTSYQPSAPMNDKQTAEITIKVTGSTMVG